MARPRKNLRLAVALRPPREVAGELVDAARELELPSGSVIAPEHLRMTVQFVGDAGTREVDAVIESVSRSCSGLAPFELTPVALRGFPEEGSARHVACVTDAPPLLMELKSRLARRLARGARRRPHDRFVPHITLARFDAPVRDWSLDVSLALPPFPVSALALERTVVVAGRLESREVAAFDL